MVVKVLTEETYRQDNQYGGVLSYLAANDPAARALTQGTLTIKMPFAVSDRLVTEQKPCGGLSSLTLPHVCVPGRTFWAMRWLIWG